MDDSPQRPPAPPAREALFGGLHAAALVLALVFLATAAVRRELDALVFGAALLAFAGATASLSRHLTDERVESAPWRRVRSGLLIGGLGLAGALAVIGVRSLLGVAREGGRLSGGASGDATRVLLVLGEGLRGMGRPAPALTSTEVLFASPRQDPALASILTGLEPIEHRVLFDGDPLPARAHTVLELLGDEGFRTRGFGGSWLPDWVHRGADGVEIQGRLADAARWLREAQGPAAALVVQSDLGPDDVDGAARFLAPVGGVVVAVGLVRPERRGPAGAVPFEVFDALGEVAWAGLPTPPPPAGYATSTGVVATVLDAVGVESLPPGVHTRPVWRPTPEGEVAAVAFRHGADGAVHVAHFTLGTTFATFVLTPLGGFVSPREGPGDAQLDDWRADGALQDHIVYRSELEAEADPDQRAALIRAFGAWREENGGWESRPEPVGAAPLR